MARDLIMHKMKYKHAAKYGQRPPVATPNTQQETTAVEDAVVVQPNPIKSLESLMQTIIQNHYEQVYKELMSYEQRLIQQMQAAQQKKEPDDKN